MGGAATWIATGETTEIDGVITDSAYARFDQAMNQFFDRKLPGGHVIFKPVIWIAEAMTGLRPEKVRPVDYATHWKGRPALIIQGDADTLITPDHAQRLSEAAGCPLWTVHGAEHAQAYDTDRHGYVDHVVKFAEGLR